MASTPSQPNPLSESGDLAELSDQELAEAPFEDMAKLYDRSLSHLTEGDLVNGTIVEIGSNDVVVDVGFKSEGLIPVDEFRGGDGLTVEVGDEVEVLLEQLEGADGHVGLSYSKAEKLKSWNRLEKAYQNSEVITGIVVDRIKGGLTVDVGVRAFLPGSLVDVKPVRSLESLKGEELEFKVINLDRRRSNVVLSRRAVLEREYEAKKAETLENLHEGQIIKGAVKNLTEYGAFVDLGGLDGLLHVTDMSWGRVNHPSEMFSVGDEVEVVVLKFDREKERVSLGYKQRTEDPWTLVDKKYPLGSRVKGRVVSLVEYGAFVELEEGVEGLVHVSEMSWTGKVSDPSTVVAVDDQVEAIVTELDLDQRRISLSLRQADHNPWEDLVVTHPVGTLIEGTVRNLTDFGAFIQVTDEIDGLVHVSDMSWNKRIKHPSEVLKKGEKVQARITQIDAPNQRVSLSIKEFLPNDWQDFVDSHKVGDRVVGRVVNVAEFGLFIDVCNGLEGLAHVSEIDVDDESLAAMFEVGEPVAARVLRIDEEDNKIALTLRGVDQPSAEEIEALAESEPQDDSGATEAAGEEE